MHHRKDNSAQGQPVGKARNASEVYVNGARCIPPLKEVMRDGFNVGS